MTALHWLLFVAAVLATVAVCYVVAIPILAWLLPRREPRAIVRRLEPDVIVIIPAHDMEGFIERCVRSLRACEYPESKLTIVVAADHCSDKTAERSRAAGATVLERQNGAAGKTYTIAWALSQLAEHGLRADLYLVVDATVHVDRAFLSALADRWKRGEDIVIAHPIVDPANRLWFAQCVGLTLAHRNLQNRARERLGCSAFISGRGMAYSRDYIDRFAWTLALPTTEEVAHPTEDFRHGVRVVEAGYRAAFADDARLYTPLRPSLSAATKQGIRWERGRIRNAFGPASTALAAGLRQGRWRLVLASVDALQPPAAILAALSMGVALLHAVASVHPAQFLFGLVPLVLIVMYAVAVVLQGRHDGIRLVTVLWAPIYLAWRCMAFLTAALSPARAGTVQTETGRQGTGA